MLAQVAAQTGHNVTMVDMTDDILAKTTAHIQKNLARVAKKQYKDNAEVAIYDLSTSRNLNVIIINLLLHGFLPATLQSVCRWQC